MEPLSVRVECTVNRSKIKGNSEEFKVKIPG